MILSGILLTPTGTPFKNAYVRLDAVYTSQQVLKATSSSFRTDVDGEYSIDCPFGTYSVIVHYSGSYQSIGIFSIDENTTETNINDLLILNQTAASNPLVQEIRQLTADAETAAEEAQAAAAQSNQYNISTWALTQAFQVISATRDSNGAIISASIKWPDGVNGVFTTDIASVAFPGAIDAWHATYLATVPKLITQPAVTRDSNGAVVAQPAITIV